LGGEYEGYDEYEETKETDDHTETPWETVPPEVKTETNDHNDLNGYMRFLNKVQ